MRAAVYRYVPGVYRRGAIGVTSVGAAAAAASTSRPAMVFEEDAIVRVLARRPERTGSKLLKETHRMSKRLK